VFRSLSAVPQDEGHWPAIRRWVGPYVCPPLATLSRDVRPESWAGRVGGTASIRPLSCAEGLIGCCWDGWRWLSQPVPTGPQG
jgi:hypothetical protein